MTKFFRPYVLNEKVDDTKFVWTGVMPHDIRSRAWSIMCDLQDHIVVMDSDSTILSVSPNPGYTAHESLVVLVTSTYLAMYEKFENLISFLTAEDHLKRMHAMIQFPNEVGAGEIKPYLSVYIAYRAKKIVSDAYSTRYLSIDWLESQKEKIISAKNRIKYIPLTDLSLAFWEKKSLLKKCDEYLAQMDQFIIEANEANIYITHNRQASEKIIETFKIACDKDPLGCRSAFESALVFVTRNSMATQDMIDKFHSTNNITALVHSAEALAPAAPVIVTKK